MSSPLKPLPPWADVALIPLINVAAAFVISGFVVLAIGENPLEAVQILITGALGDLEGIGFTLYYATSFIFTGLAVAICFHAGLFNIGVEGQAYIAGLGAALAALHLGFLPGYSLRHRRDPRRRAVRRRLRGDSRAICRPSATATSSSRRSCSTTSPPRIMGYLLVNVLRVPGQMNAETAAFPPRRPRAAIPRSAGAASASTGR